MSEVFDLTTANDLRKYVILRACVPSRSVCKVFLQVGDQEFQITPVKWSTADAEDVRNSFCDALAIAINESRR